MAGFAVGHALPTHYHGGLKRSAMRNMLVRLSRAFIATLFTAVLFLLNKLELTITLSFIKNALCFTNKNAISQITAGFSVFTKFFRIKIEKYPCCLWWMFIDFQINLLCPHSPPLCNAIIK